MPEKLIWETREVTNNLEDWILLLILISVIILVVVKVIKSEFISELVSSIVVPKMMARESSSQIGWTDTERILMLTVYFIIGPLFFTLVFANSFSSISSQTHLFAFFSLFFVALIFAFFLRLFVLFLIEWVVGKTDIITEYSFSIGQSNRFIGLFLIPITLLAVVLPKSQGQGILIFGLIILVLIYVLRIMRMIINSLKIPRGFFYIILYLCTFEILPFLYVFHLVKMIVKG